MSDDNMINDLVDAGSHSISNVLPSVWYEKNRIMTSDVSAIPGPFSYNNSPYAREIVDCFSQHDDARIIGVKKAAQIGISASVIEPAIGYIASQQPGNILYLVGHSDLLTNAGMKIDRMLDNTCDPPLRELIGSSDLRVRRTKSGDTDKQKEFPGGYLSMGPTNHKTLRQQSIQYGFVDDFDGMKGATKEAGSTEKMVEQRFATFKTKMKLAYISSPELEATSNIERVFLKGDQRKYNIPCPCCGELIILQWEIQSEKDKNNMCGMTWSLDDTGELISESVGYTCYKCEGFFDDSAKAEWLLEDGYGGSAKWIPTSKQSRPGYKSYQISALYAMPFMYDWEHYVRDYMEACPLGKDKDEELYQTFVNTVLGETYEPSGKSIKATDLMRNCRVYPIGIVPTNQSIADGNGDIVALTCAADLNGKEQDARLDYEIVAWSETGSSYSVTHGSIGTFIPKDPGKVDRTKWTYEKGQPNNVWDEFTKVLTAKYKRDNGLEYGIYITGLDTGFMTQHAYDYIDNFNGGIIVGIKGKDETKFVDLTVDRKIYAPSKSKSNLYLVESNWAKDQLDVLMKLKWDKDYHEVQPPGFMNFPEISGGLYNVQNFFSHFEAESKVYDNGKFLWKKKSPNHQNHLYDCRLYNMVVREILVMLFFKEVGIKGGIWKDYCDIVLGRRKV